MDYISPIGVLRIKVTEKGLNSIKYISREEASKGSDSLEPSEKEKSCIALCVSALNRYFAKQWGAFEQLRLNIPLDIEGEPFKKRILAAVYSMPNTYPIVGMYYSELACLVGSPGLLEECVKICGENRIPIIIPCHRLVQRNERLGSYVGGTERKSWLLWHEGAMPKSSKTSILLQQPPQAR